jgi:hypothetical protein
MTIDSIQLRIVSNLRSQSNTLDRRGYQSQGIVARYSSRDRTSGARRLTGNDGSIVLGQFISNSAPQNYPPAVVAGGLGRSIGFVDQRPV